MRVGQDKVAIPLHEVYGDLATANQHLRNHAFQGLAKLDSDGIGVLADDLNSVDRGEPLLIPGASLHARRRSGSLVIADHAQRGAGARHYDP